MTLNFPANFTHYHLNATLPAASGHDFFVVKFASLNSIIAENEIDQNIFLFPNPSLGIFSITQNNTNKIGIEIFNIVGYLIYKTNTTNQQTTIDLSKEAKGIYFVKVTDPNKNVRSKKIMIQ